MGAALAPRRRNALLVDLLTINTDSFIRAASLRRDAACMPSAAAAAAAAEWSADSVAVASSIFARADIDFSKGSDGPSLWRGALAKCIFHSALALRLVRGRAATASAS